MRADRLQAQHRPQQEQRRAGRPGLRAARGRVLDGIARHRALVPAEGLWQPALEELRSVEDAGRDRGRLLLEPVPPQAPGDDRAVERPDRPDVVSDRVVATFALRERPDAPAGEQPPPQQVPRDRLRLRLLDDAAPEQVSVVRGERIDPAAVLIEREREVFAVLDPEIAVESPLEIGGLLLEPVGEGLVLPHPASEPRAADLRVVRVALKLAGRTGEARDPTVPVRDRVPGVLPALVLEPGLLVAALVPDVAVALEVRVLADPAQRRPRLVLELADELGVARPALVLVEQDDGERCRVRAAGVGRVRRLLERR